MTVYWRRHHGMIGKRNEPALAERWTDPDWLPAFLDGGPDLPDLPDQLTTLYGLEVAVFEVTIELSTLNDFEADLLGVAAGSHAFLLSTEPAAGAGSRRGTNAEPAELPVLSYLS
jgi:hypothetical protein